MLPRLIVCAFLAVFISGALAATNNADVVVYGGTPAGIAAAIEVARNGLDPVLIVPEGRLGGMTASGLGATDVAGARTKDAVGGLSREFYRRVHAHYSNPAAWKFDAREDHVGYKYWGFIPAIDKDTMWTFEPSVALKIFKNMLADYGVKRVVYERLNRENGVKKEGAAIRSIATVEGNAYEAKTFVDATYEGDLLAAAGVSYALGREPQSLYGESLAGVHYREKRGPRVDPYKTQGDPTSGLLPLIEPSPPGKEGDSDNRVMAYCYRLCLTDVPANRVPFPRPKNYDPQLYELLLRYIAVNPESVNIFSNNIRMPNGKTDMNNGNPYFALNLIGGSKDYPEADDDAREKIVQRHKDYQQGYLYFLANDPRVPQSIRDEVNRFGLPKDEFEKNGHWPEQLYVREGRRLQGEYLMTEHHARQLAFAEDPVGMAGNHVDSHQTTRYLTTDGSVDIEGIFIDAVYPFGISMRSLLPKREECANLVVPVGLSATHSVFGSIRMEPVFMVLGESAGTIASMAAKKGVPVQQVDYQELRRRLLENGQALPSLEEGRAVAFDEAHAVFKGQWKKGDKGDRVGLTFSYTGENSDGCSVKFPIHVKKAGLYDVRFYYRNGPDRKRDATVVIDNGSQKTTRKVDLTVWPKNKTNISLGKIRFTPEKPAFVELRSDDGEGVLSADAVLLLPLED